MTTKLYAFHHVVWTPQSYGQLKSYLEDMRAPWYAARYTTAVHEISGLWHTFVIRKRGCNPKFTEVGVEFLREGFTR